MSRSALSLATSRRKRSISSCSGFIWPCPGKACPGSAVNSFTHLRRTFSWTSRSRAAYATLTPRSLISRTASILNSCPNRLRCIPHLRLHETPNLGVHETGSRPEIESDRSRKMKVPNRPSGRYRAVACKSDGGQRSECIVGSGVGEMVANRGDRQRSWPLRHGFRPACGLRADGGGGLSRQGRRWTIPPPQGPCFEADRSHNAKERNYK